MKDKKIDKVVLAYSGGLDTSVILKWLQVEYGCEVICFAADLGQGEELDPVREKAMKTGASKIYIDDLREEFARDFVFPMLRANTLYEGTYMLGTSIARPLIAKRQIEIAQKEGCQSVSHGATGKGNDQVRFELTYYALMPHVHIIAPWREWKLDSRQSLLDFAAKHGIDVPVTPKKPYSSDRNLLHISFEGGILEDPWNAPPEDMFMLSVSPEKAPNQSEDIEIEYDRGNPIKLNGQALTPAAMMQALNKLGGKHGIGRVDMVENRFVGMKSRGVYETPGGSILHVAHRALESITMDREVMHIRDRLMPHYAELVYYGFWYAPERELLQNMIDESQKDVSGTVRVKLYKGNVTVLGRKSPKSLFHQELATFEKDSIYRQADAEGFIKLNALRLRMRKILGHV